MTRLRVVRKWEKSCEEMRETFEGRDTRKRGRKREEVKGER